MQTWAKRGLQTALVTGGLLMLGTGIASAQEDVNPDKPASPLDGSLSIPLQIKDNAVGTPLGQIDLPNVEKTISSDAVTDKLPAPLAGPAKKVSGELGKAAAPATGTISGVTAPHAAPKPHAGLSDLTHGNVLHNHAAVPVQIAGNAIALGGPAKVQTDAKQDFNRSAPVNTSANGLPLGGNVAGLTGALPIQLANNAVGLGAHAESKGQAKQSAAIGGPINSDGSGAPLAGNVLKGQLADPIQVTGNAIGGGGQADVESKAQSSATADGAIKTSGEDGQLSGNVGAAPVAVPVEANGNALSGIGQANAVSKNKAHAQAGNTNKDSLGNPFYNLTSGKGGSISGNILQPELAGPAMLNGSAGSLGGKSVAAGETDNHVRAGGGAGTNGREGALSGNIGNAPVAYPVQVFGNGVAALTGDATAAHKNKVDSKAGNSNMAYGDDSTLSGNDVVPTLAGSGDLFGSGLSVLANADGTGKNKTKSHSGGYVGTTGNHSQGSGNIVHPPLALPVQLFGLGGSAAGSASGTADNKKDIGSGGPPNSNDDDGVVSSNVVHTPGSIPVELFGDSAALVANATGIGKSELKSNAGGDATGTGIGGTIAGNVVQAAISQPVQGFGDALGVVGQSDGLGKNVTASNAGGDTTSDGSGGSLAGNAIAVPSAGAAQLFGSTAGVVGNLTGVADNDTTSTAGGDVNTTGEKGSGSGNVLGAQLLPVLQGFGDGISVLANGSAAASNNTAAGSGGDINTSGKDGALSGNLLDFPVALVGQAFGDAIAIGGNQEASGDNDLVGVVGGKDATEGEHGAGSGFLHQHPIGIVGQFYNIPFEILGNAITSATNASSVTVADKPAQFDFPVDGAGLPVDQLPELPELPAGPALPVGGAGAGGAMPGLPVQSGGDANAVHAAKTGPVKTLPMPNEPISGVLPDFGNLVQLPGLGGGNLPQVPGLGGNLPVQGLPGLGGGDLPQVPGLGGELPGVPGLGGELPGVPGLGGGLPTLPGVGGALPGLPTQGLPGVGGDELPGMSLVDNFMGGLDLPGVPAVPGMDKVTQSSHESPLPGLPGVPDISGVLPIESLPGVGGALPGVPAVPGLPGVPGLPVQGGGVPGLPELPGVPELPGLGGDLPGLPGLGGELPGVPGVPGVPELPGLPGLGAAQQDGNLPALSVLDSGDLTGVLGNLEEMAPKHV